MSAQLADLLTHIEKAQSGMEAAVVLLRQSRDALESCADFLAENGYSNRARSTYELAQKITAALTPETSDEPDAAVPDRAAVHHLIGAPAP